jgi:anti-sigma factor RsiW
VLGRLVFPSKGRMSVPTHRRGGSWTASAVVIGTVVSTGMSLAPAAYADAVANLKSAVEAARDGASCGPLRYNPVVEHTAEIAVRSTDEYIEHSATALPLSDPLPVLKDLGYAGSKTMLLSGHGSEEADAIKGVLIEGHAAIRDCSYTDFGVSVRLNETTSYSLASAVLAGP